MKVLSFLIILILILIGRMQAKEATGADFLKFIVNARVGALGGSFVGLADDLSCIHYNPAGLAILKEAQSMFFMYSEAVEGVSGYQIIDYYKKIPRYGDFGCGLIYYRNDYPITKKESSNPWEPIGEGKYQDFALSFAYAKSLKINNLSLGIGLKYVNRRLDDKDNKTYIGKAYAIDCGLLKYYKNLSIGLALQNLGTKIYFKNKEKKDNLPTNLSFGIAYKINNIKFLSDVRYMLLKHSEIEYGTGIEVDLTGVFSLRIGYMRREGNIKGVSVGCGFNLKNISIDFADIPSGELTRLKQFSLKLRF
jgi:hypothetical protein